VLLSLSLALIACVIACGGGMAEAPWASRGDARNTRAGTLAPADDPSVADETPAGQLCDSTVRLADSLSRPATDGEPLEIRHLPDAPVRLDFLRGQVRGDRDRVDRALRASEDHTRLIDPVWGGVFMGARTSDGSALLVEKRTRQQAAALQAFGAAYVATNDATWLDRVEDVDRYVAAQLESPDGRFYAMQRATAPALPPGMDALAYYQLPDAERRRYGVPPVDHALDAELNGLMIEAYADLARETGDARFLAKARRAADSWLRTSLLPSGAVRQANASSVPSTDPRMIGIQAHDGMHLASQARFGLGLVALYRASLDPRYLAAARRLVAATRHALEPNGGGFYASEDDGVTDAARPKRPAGNKLAFLRRSIPARRVARRSHTPGMLAPRALRAWRLDAGRRSVYFPPDAKPIGANAAMARLMTWVGFIDHDEALLADAEHTLRRVASPAALRGRGPEPVAEAALVWELLSVGPVEISPVGEAGDPALAHLVDAARTVRDPLRVIHADGDSRYPQQDRAAVFVCSRVACSSPLFTADDMVRRVADFAHAPADTPCGG